MEKESLYMRDVRFEWIDVQEPPDVMVITPQFSTPQNMENLTGIGSDRKVKVHSYEIRYCEVSHYRRVTGVGWWRRKHRTLIGVSELEQDNQNEYGHWQLLSHAGVDRVDRVWIELR